MANPQQRPARRIILGAALVCVLLPMFGEAAAQRMLEHGRTYSGVETQQMRQEVQVCVQTPGSCACYRRVDDIRTQVTCSSPSECARSGGECRTDTTPPGWAGVHFSCSAAH